MKVAIDDLDDDFYKGGKVFLRVDFNVPIEKGNLKEYYRIRRAIKTKVLIAQ